MKEAITTDINDLVEHSGGPQVMLGHLSFAMRRPFEILHGCFDNLEVYIISVFASIVYLANKKCTDLGKTQFLTLIPPISLL